ncbi:MAG: PKD domain-containing protein, partial [Bacteroidia bacterium]
MKKILPFIGLTFCLHTTIHAQMITTVVGYGSPGSSGDGGIAFGAQIANPNGITFDAAGNMYVAQQGAFSIRKITTAGIISTVAGNGTSGYSGDGGQATAATLNNPAGITLDTAGNIYIADYTNSSIRKVTNAGIISTIAGNGTGAFSGNGGQATAAELYNPTCVALDNKGNIYIADYGNSSIRKITTAGIISNIAGNGAMGFAGDGAAATASQLQLPSGITTDAVGNIFIADKGNNRIRKINTTGIINTVAGNGTAAYSGDGGQATAASLNNPSGVGFDATGNMYIADKLNNVVRKVTTAGIISTVAGNNSLGASYTGDGGAAIAAQLNNPANVAFSPVGNMYIADGGNNVVRQISTPATVNSATICLGATATLTASGSTSYTWSPATGLSATTGSVVVASPTVTTTYTISYPDYFGTTATITSTVTVNSLPTLTVTVSSPTLCAGTTTTLTANGANTYTWNTGATSVSISPSPTITTNYTVTGTNANNCIGKNTATITVNPLPAASFTADHPCSGVGMNFNNTTPSQGTVSSWYWNFGDGSTSNISFPSAHTYSAAGCYSVVLTATTTAGCTNSYSTVVNVHSNPNVNFTASSVCNGNGSQFTDASSITNPTCLTDHITSWQWTFGDGTTSTQTSPTHTFAACGIYTVALTVTTNYSCTATISKADTVFCLPTVVGPIDFTVCPGAATPVQTFTTTCANGGTPQAQWFQSMTTVNNTGAPPSFLNPGGFNQVPTYNAIAQNLNCSLLKDTVFAVAISGVGCIGNITHYIANVFPTPTVTPTSNFTICANSSVPSINFTGCPVFATDNWANSNTSIGLNSNGTGNIASFIGQNNSNMPDIATVSVTASANGCTGPASTFSITINPVPLMFVTSPTPYCPGDIISSTTNGYNVNTDPVGGVTYNWTATNQTNTGMPASGTGAAPNSPYSAPANPSQVNQVSVITYTPSLNGCVGLPVTETLTIKPTPIMQATPSQFWCPGNMTTPVTFSTMPTSSSSTYMWAYNSSGVPVSGTSNPFPSLGPTQNPGPTTIPISVTVTPTLNGCVGPPGGFTIYVYPNPVARFSSSNRVCDGSPMSFTDHSTPNTGSVTINSWQWDMNSDGSIDMNSQNPIYIYPTGSAGTNSVTLYVGTNSVPSCTAHVTENIYINPKPVADFVGDSLTGCSILHTDFTNLSTVITPNTGLYYYWSFGNGNTSAIAIPPPQSYTNSSTTQNVYYTVSLTTTTDSGCVNTKTKVHYIDVLACANNGIEKYQSSNEVAIYPNPNNG